MGTVPCDLAGFDQGIKMSTRHGVGVARPLHERVEVDRRGFDMPRRHFERDSEECETEAACERAVVDVLHGRWIRHLAPPGLTLVASSETLSAAYHAASSP